MRKSCVVCGDSFEAKRKDARTCSASCRSKKRYPTPPQDDPLGNPLVVAVRAELEAAGKLDSMLGQLALSLAARVKSEASGVSALSRELRAVTAAAVGAQVSSSAAGGGDGVDELRDRRDAKRAV